MTENIYVARDEIAIALQTIANFPISHPENMDAHNMQAIASRALTLSEDERFKRLTDFSSRAHALACLMLDMRIPLKALDLKRLADFEEKAIEMAYGKERDRREREGGER